MKWRDLYEIRFSDMIDYLLLETRIEIKINFANDYVRKTE